uniref:FGGY_N domain-containing protein n=1 Tax=Angiostrongylus cantonensis TaxID=6313 RepID=A0A0K0D188_ANGCA
MQYIVAVDVGTTTIRACLYDDKCRLVNVASDKIQVEISGNGELRVEIDPGVLFDQFIQALNVIGAVFYFFTRNPRFKAARMLKFLSSMVSHRVMVTIQQVSGPFL